MTVRSVLQVVASWCACAAASAAVAHGPPGALFDAIADRVEARYHAPERIDWDVWRAAHRPASDVTVGSEAWHRAMERAFDALGDRHSRWLGVAGPLGPGGAPSRAASKANEFPALDVAYDPDARVTTVRLATIEPGSAEAVREAAMRAMHLGSLGLVLDLRGNRGGDPIEIGRIAALFGARGTVLEAWSRGRSLWRLEIGTDGTNGVAWIRDDGPYEGSAVQRRPGVAPLPVVPPLAVVIDATTASAAEGLAEALRTAVGAGVVGASSAGRVEVARRVGVPGGFEALLAIAELRAKGGGSFAPVRPDVAVAPTPTDPAGRDGASSEAIRIVRGWRFGPARWFRRSARRRVRRSARCRRVGIGCARRKRSGRVPRMTRGTDAVFGRAGHANAPRRTNAAGRAGTPLRGRNGRHPNVTPHRISKWCARQDSNL